MKSFKDFGDVFMFEDCEGKNILCLKRSPGAGLFSNLTVLLWGLIECRKSNLMVHALSSGVGLEFYKDRINDDPVSELFSSQDVDLLSMPIPEKPFPHSEYKNLDYEQLRPYIHGYFSPSPIVKNLIQSIVNDYLILPGAYSCVCYRGTDKVNELALQDPEKFSSICNFCAKKLGPRFGRLLLQTDDFDAFEKISSTLETPYFRITQMPMTKSKLAIHFNKFPERKQFALLLLAVNIIISKSSVLITHTGNMALWQFLYRGSFGNCFQL